MLPHLLDEVLELHGDVYDPLYRGLVAAGELDQGHQPRLQRELGLDRRGGERDDGPRVVKIVWMIKILVVYLIPHGSHFTPRGKMIHIPGCRVWPELPALEWKV